MSHSHKVSVVNNDPSVLSKGCLSACYFFQWCNEGTHIWGDICARPVIFWKVHSPTIKSIFLCSFFFLLYFCCRCLSWSECPWNTCWDRLGGRHPNKVGVMIGIESDSQEKQVSLIGPYRCAHSRGSAAIGRAETPLLGKDEATDANGVCGQKPTGEVMVGVRDGVRGMGVLLRGTDHLDHEPQRPALTESIWTTVNRRQPVCWLPPLTFSLAAFQQTHAVQQRLSEEASARVFSTKSYLALFCSAYWKEKWD